MNNEYKAFEEWADSQGWFKLQEGINEAIWISNKGTVIYLRFIDGKLSYAEQLINTES